MKWSLAAVLVASGLGLGLGACGGPPDLAAGQTCHASSECGPGLLCDFSQDPAVCAMAGPPPADAAPDANPFQPDAAPTPDAAPGTPDAPPTPDAAVPDAAVDAMAADAAVDAM
jgi:hypothetical protein